MLRFSETRLRKYITDLTNEIGRKPRVLELTHYINCSFHREDFDTYDDYSFNLTGESVVQRYINTYGLQDLVSMTKRRTKAEIEEEKAKQAYYEEYLQNQNKQWNPNSPKSQGPPATTRSWTHPTNNIKEENEKETPIATTIDSSYNSLGEFLAATLGWDEK